MIAINVFAQEDYPTLDRLNYEAFLKGDVKAFKSTSKKLLSNKIDYYYLRMRMGIIDFNSGKYSGAVSNFSKALNFYDLDTISREYIFYSYIYSGRVNDAYSYLSGIPNNKLNKQLRSVIKPTFKYLFSSLTYSTHNDAILNTNIPAGYYYEALSSSQSLDLGFNTYIGEKWLGTFAYKNFRKDGLMYSDAYPTGIEPDFTQNQIYGSFTRLFYPGWELSFFGHGAFYSGAVTEVQTRGNRFSKELRTEFAEGISLSKRSWYVRGELGVSASNFSLSNQVRGEASFTVYPTGNLNLYITSSGMLQNDNKWGKTYQLNQDIGFKVTNFLWVESGVSKGNSFLNSRNRAFFVNNSYTVGNKSAYINLIFLLGKYANISLTTFYNNTYSYSWNFENFTRTNLQPADSYGAILSLTIKHK